MKRATKVRIYPDEEQAAFLNAQFGSVRFVFNKALHLMRHQYERHGVSLKPLRDIKPLLVVAKNCRSYHWLKEYDSQASQQGLINLDRAFNNFFQQRAKFPRFKNKNGMQSSYHPYGNFFCYAILLPKMKPVIHRQIIGTVSSIMIKCMPTKKYYVAILVDYGREAAVNEPVIKKVKGSDMGLSDFVITSNDDKIPNPCFLKRASASLRRKQKALFRKHKASANSAKARLQVEKYLEQVANCHADYHTKLSRSIIDDNQAIILETLKSANMMKNHRPARALGDASWHSFMQKLSYKAEESGKYVVKIDQGYTSSKTFDCSKHKMAQDALG